MPSISRPLEWVVPLLALLFAFGLTATFNALPDPMASEWTIEGMPVDHRPRLLELLVGPVIVGFAGITPLFWAQRVQTVRAARGLVVAGHVLVVLLAGHRWRSITANYGAPDWQSATTTVSSIPVIVLAAVAGAFGWWASAHRKSQG